jgi:hypothetical protein
MCSCFLARGDDALDVKSLSPRPIETRLTTPVRHDVSPNSYTASSDSLIPCNMADEHSSAILLWRDSSGMSKDVGDQLRRSAPCILRSLKTRSRLGSWPAVRATIAVHRDCFEYW